MEQNYVTVTLGTVSRITSQCSLILLRAGFPDVQPKSFVEVSLGVFPHSRGPDLSSRGTAATDLEQIDTVVTA